MAIKPLRDLVVVRPKEPPKESKGGVLLPDEHVAAQQPYRGTVLAVGPGERLEDGTLAPMSVQPGDEVFYPLYIGHDVELDDLGKVKLLRDIEILAVVRPPEKDEIAATLAAIGMEKFRKVAHENKCPKCDAPLVLHSGFQRIQGGYLFDFRCVKCGFDCTVPGRKVMVVV